jgi:hypothetical protein
MSGKGPLSYVGPKVALLPGAPSVRLPSENYLLAVNSAFCSN